MRIKIESDVFDIVKRITEIDDGYYIVFNMEKNTFEIHNSNQFNSYCFTSKNSVIDSRIIDEINYSKISNIDKIIEEIDKYNELNELTSKQKAKDDADYMLREIYKYSSNSSRDYNETEAFSMIWR